MSIDLVRKELVTAINELFEHEPELFLLNVGEETISHRLAVRLDPSFRDKWHVDCEYNRDGLDKTKYIEVFDGPLRKRAEERARKRGHELWQAEVDDRFSVFPDIIIHHRGYSGHRHNLFVIEIKKTTNKKDWDSDHQKLQILTADYFGSEINYHYQVGLFLVFEAWRDVPKKGTHRAVGTWFQNGNQLGEPVELAKRDFDLTPDE